MNAYMTGTIIIIQARLGSSRLPAKVMLPLPTERLVIQEVVHRCRQVKGIDRIVVATTPHDAPILKQVVSELDAYVYGPPNIPEEDVLARFYVTAKHAGAGRIIRVTADCPFLNPHVISKLIELHNRERVQYASNVYPKRTFPKGWDCELFTSELLQQAYFQATTAYEREHVTPWMQANADTVNGLEQQDDRSGESMVLDTLEDFRKLWGKVV